MTINKKFAVFLSSLVVLTNFSWLSSISFASIRFSYIPNATIGFSLLRHSKNNNFNINFNLGNNFYLKLNDKMALFAGANIGISGLLNQNNRTTLPQYTSINAIANEQSANTSNTGGNDGTAGTLTNNNTGNNEQINNGLNDDIITNENQFQYIKNEYPDAETYANEIRAKLISQANKNIKANSTAIDNYMQNYGDYLFLDSSKSKTSPLNINYEAIKSDVNNDIFFNNNIYLDKHINDDYINWDEAIAIYHTIVNDGNNENAKIYAQLMTGLKNRPENFDNDPYNILLTDDGKQQLYATHDRMQIINDNNNITQSIINHVLQDKKDESNYIYSIGDIVANDKISIEEIKTIIQNTENYNKIIALQDSANDDYTSWNEAKQEYQTYLNEKNIELENNEHDTIAYNEQDAEKYAMIMTGLMDEPHNYNQDPSVILERERQELEDGYHLPQFQRDVFNFVNEYIQDSYKDDRNVMADWRWGLYDLAQNYNNEYIDGDKEKSVDDIKKFIQAHAQQTGYTSNISWEEAINEYKQIWRQKADKEIRKYGSTGHLYRDEDAEVYAMIRTGITEIPDTQNKNSNNEQNSQQTHNSSNNPSTQDNNNNSNNNVNNTNVGNHNIQNNANEKIVDKHSFRERFNFSIPIGVNVKINDKVSVEPYWLVGFNVAQANVIQNNSSTRLTKVGFTTGLGTRVLFCKEIFFVGLEYRFAQNTFERAKIQSHNVNFSIGVRFNFTTLANLIK